MTHSSTWLRRPQETFNHGGRGSKHVLHGSKQEKENLYVGKHCHFQNHQISREFTHCHENRMGETIPMIQSPPTMSHFDIWRLQFEMRFGWGHRAKPHHSTLAPTPPILIFFSHFKMQLYLFNSSPKTQIIPVLIQRSKSKISSETRLSPSLHESVKSRTR